MMASRLARRHLGRLDTAFGVRHCLLRLLWRSKLPLACDVALGLPRKLKYASYLRRRSGLERNKTIFATYFAALRDLGVEAVI